MREINVSKVGCSLQVFSRGKVKAHMHVTCLRRWRHQIKLLVVAQEQGGWGAYLVITGMGVNGFKEPSFHVGPLWPTALLCKTLGTQKVLSLNTE